MKKPSLRNFIKEARNDSSSIDSESKETFAIQVGIRLKEARKYSQSITEQTLTDIADQLDIDRTTICHYEAGRRIPSLLHFKKMCERYNVDPVDILNVKYKGGHTIHKFIESAESIKPDDAAYISPEEECSLV